MEKQRQIKVLSIIALVLAIAGLSLGFAAFSTTLNISSSATVTPSNDSFKVQFVPAEDRGTVDEVYADVADGADANSAKIVGTSLTGIEALFNDSGQVVYYKVDIYNAGQYDAYLNSIDFGSKTCTASGDATDELVQAACGDIYRRVTLSSYSGEYWNEQYEESESYIFDDVIISPGEKISMEYFIIYTVGGARADGDFNVEFGDVVFNFSTVPNSSVELISFTVEGVSYQAEPGMTWSEWTISSYNTDGYIDKETMIVPAVQMCSKTRIDGAVPTEVIVAGDYSIRHAGACAGG